MGKNAENKRLNNWHGNFIDKYEFLNHKKQNTNQKGTLMGQQQLLLIVLGVIIVGIAIVVGINLFQASAVEANRNAVIADLNNLAAQAQQYFKKPTTMGGGGNSFVGFAIPTGMGSNANGTYTISTAGTATAITFQGTGTETGDNGSSGVQHRAAVTATTITITKVN